MFNHAQSVYWVGEVARQRGQIDQAAAQFREYRRLAERMIAAEPDNHKWQLEGVYSAGNLGRVELDQTRYADATATFQKSVNAMELLASAQPANREYLELQLEMLAYHADALDWSGQIDMAIQQRDRQLALLAPYLAQTRPDADLRRHALVANMALSRLRFRRGENKRALDHAAAAVSLGRQLVELEPGSADWAGRTANALLNQAQLFLRAGNFGEARNATEQGCDLANRLTARDPSVVLWRDFGRNCLRLRAELAAANGSAAEAALLANQVLEAVKSDRGGTPKERFNLALADKLLGDVLWRAGDRAGAITAWKSGLTAWPNGLSETPEQMGARGEMLRGIGQRAAGNQIAAQLSALGYRQSITNRAKV
jgi:tetratricopeptide (TPR) repeat protein